MNDDLKTLYGWVRSTREILLGYTEGLPAEVYVQERPDFAFGSIRNLHAHVAHCYLWWLGFVRMGKEGYQVDPLQIPDPAAMRKLFARVDSVVEEALEGFSNPDQVYAWAHPTTGWTLNVSGRWLLMHPITHEFHHKGQMVALGRVLGHPAVFPSGSDTDLVPPG